MDSHARVDKDRIVAGVLNARAKLLLHGVILATQIRELLVTHRTHAHTLAVPRHSC